MANRDVDLRAAINAISDVIQNRPKPIRELDQIYMKAGDMVLQSELIANWADGKKIAFIGDGDAISVCMAYLKHKQILKYGPSKITVFDFDERICNAVNHFAKVEELDNLSAVLYNCIEKFPAQGMFDFFYTNPPWGGSNGGSSVCVFVERGIEAVGYSGEGVVVIADDHEMLWPQEVLAETQRFGLEKGFYVQKMDSKMHHYHLDDNPDLKSCNLYFKSLPNNEQFMDRDSQDIVDKDRLNNFYGRDQDSPSIRYVKALNKDKFDAAPNSEYEVEYFKGRN